MSSSAAEQFKARFEEAVAATWAAVEHGAKADAVDELVAYVGAEVAAGNFPETVGSGLLEIVEKFKQEKIATQEAGVVAKVAAAGMLVGGSASSAPKAKPKKRAPNSYNIFMSEKMKQLKLEHPTLDNSALMTMSLAAYKEAKALNDINAAARGKNKKKGSSAAAADAAADEDADDEAEAGDANGEEEAR